MLLFIIKSICLCLVFLTTVNDLPSLEHASLFFVFFFNFTNL